MTTHLYRITRNGITITARMTADRAAAHVVAGRVCVLVDRPARDG